MSGKRKEVSPTTVEPDAERGTLSREEIERIIEEADDPHVKLIITMLYHCGLRLGERGVPRSIESNPSPFEHYRTFRDC